MTDQGESRCLAAERLIEALAKSLAVYYASERAFMACPTEKTAHAYLVSHDRFCALRDESRHANRVGDALVGTEDDESVGR